MYEHLSSLEYGVIQLTSIIETHPDRDIIHQTHYRLNDHSFAVVTLYQYPCKEVIEEQPHIIPIYIVTKWGTFCKPIFYRRSTLKQALREYKKMGGQYDKTKKIIHLLGNKKED